jgi:hypothetical protein
MITAAATAMANDCLERIGRVDLAPQIPAFIAVDGSRALIAGSGVVRLVDFSDPEDPSLIGAYDPDDWGAGPLDLAGDLAFVCDTWNGLVHILDLQDPTRITEVGLIDVGSVWSVEVVPPFAYVGAMGLSIFDVSDPATPTLAGATTSIEPAKDLSVDLPHVYVANWWNGLQIVDVSDPEHPVVVGGTLEETDDWYRVEASSSYAYMPIGGTMALVDARDPENPVSVGYPFPGATADVAVEGGTALVTRPDSLDLAQFDVGRPDAPVLLDTLTISRWDAPVALAGDLGLVAGNDSMLDVVTLCDSPALDNDVWLEIAAHNDGLEASRWRTDLVVRNTSARGSDLRLILRIDRREYSLNDILDPGEQAVYEDVVGLMDAAGKGTLEVRANQPVAALARLYNLDAEGSFGQIFQGISREGGLRSNETAWLHGLRQEIGRFRTNISITNTSTSYATVRIALFDGSGAELAAYELPTIRPGTVVQEVEPLATRAGRPNVGWAMAEITVLDGEGILASASVIDSRTNDPSTVPFWRPDP